MNTALVGSPRPARGPLGAVDVWQGYASVSREDIPSTSASLAEEQPLWNEPGIGVPTARPSWGFGRHWVIRSIACTLGAVLLSVGAGAAWQMRAGGFKNDERLRGTQSTGHASEALFSVPWIDSAHNALCTSTGNIVLPGCSSTTTTSTTTWTGTSTTITHTTTTTTTRTTSTTTSTSTSSSTLTSSTSSTTTTTPHDLWPWPMHEGPRGEKYTIKGISYAPVPLKRAGAVLPEDDFMTDGTAAFWGRRGDDGGIGRADLKIMKKLGANAVRLYGNDPALDHKKFLDEAMALDMHVIAGLSDYPYVQMHGNCMKTEWDCYDQIKEQYANSLENGFLVGKRYHKALRTVILMNEPDLKFEGGLRGTPGDPRHFIKALISAFDALIDAEQAAGVEGRSPNITVAFSFGRCRRCSKFSDKPALGQMYDLRYAMQHPHSVNYTARNDLWWWYQKRFTNSFNTQNPFQDIRNFFLDDYDPEFQGTPVFIGEYHAAPTFDQQIDLSGMMKMAENKSTLLIGFSFFEYQVRYDKGGGEMSFGMFGLVDDLHVADVTIVTRTYKSWCLKPVDAKSMGPQCGDTQADTDYDIPGAWSQRLDHVPAADICCTKCQHSPHCRAWTWIRDAGLPGCPSQCWLKGEGEIRKTPKDGVVSGLLPRSHQQGGNKEHMHKILTRIYRGDGVDEQDLCPLPTTTTTTTITETQKKAALLVSANWLGCYARKRGVAHWGSDDASLQSVALKGTYTAASCAKECRRSRYMLLRGDGQCSCTSEDPSDDKFRQVHDRACGDQCAESDSGCTALGIYRIKIKTEENDESTEA